MRRIFLTGAVAILATAGATSAMAYSSDYGDPALFGQVRAPAAPAGVDAGYPPRTHSKFGQLAPYQVQEVPAGNSGVVPIPIEGAVGFTREFGNRSWDFRIVPDPAGTSGYRLR